MKNYTDLEESKKLAGILPLESADMYYIYNIPYAIPYKNRIDVAKPCWSLAALLDVIPKEVKIKGQSYAPCLFPTTDGHWLYRLWYNSNEIIEPPKYVNPCIYGISFIFKEFKTYSLELIEWLNKHHFDYRGLIPKGLAIDCTNLNIY